MNNKLTEALDRHRKLVGYNYVNEDFTPNNYDGSKFKATQLSEAEPEEENIESTEDTPTEEESTDEFSGNQDFNFGGEEDETPEEQSKPESEFGNEDEFSAADDIEMTDEDEVEEIDVTDIIKKSEEAKESSDKAVNLVNQTNDNIKKLMDRFSNLEQQLTKMDTIVNKVSKLEADIKTPQEQLQLRSLDSYPFNVKLQDYWNDETNPKLKNYQVSKEDQVTTYKITPEDIENFNPSDIKKSFNPSLNESKRRK